MKKRNSLKFIWVWGFCLMLLLSGVYAVSTYNEDGDFSVEIEQQKKMIFDENIVAYFSFVINNRMPNSQSFEIQLPEKLGWDITSSQNNFFLASGESREVTIAFDANSDFVYSPSVVGPDVVKITKKGEFDGYFEFPVMISGENEDVSIKFEVTVKSGVESFEAKFSSKKLSPAQPFGFYVSGENLSSVENVIVKLLIGEEVIFEKDEVFSPDDNMKVYKQDVPASISPGIYDAKLVIRLQKDELAKEWYKVEAVEVVPYEKIEVVKQYDKSLFGEAQLLKINNKGNLRTDFIEKINFSAFASLFFGAEGAFYEKKDGGAVINVSLNRGEYKEIVYYFNYFPLYLALFIILVVFVAFYVRKISNPLDVENKIYDVKKDVHEGIKGMKVRIGFENLKEGPLEHIKIIFKMPRYINVKENSFLLVEPNHVLKGKNEYKLIWEFRNFAKNESRILGFTLVNSKGVLGDIKLPDLEIIVKRDGNVRKYKQSFPLIRG